MKGTIYGIRSVSDNNVIYVGSTVDFERRKRDHINVCYGHYKSSNLPVYSHIREICSDRENFNDYFIFDMLAEVEADNRRQIKAVENEYIEKLSPKYNVNRAYVSRETYLAEERERVKTLYDTSTGYAEKMRAMNKKWFEDHPNYYKAWSEKNKEKRREYSRKYKVKKKKVQIL